MLKRRPVDEDLSGRLNLYLYDADVTRQPPVPKGWRFPLKEKESSDYFPGVDDIVWLGQPPKPSSTYVHPTISLSRNRPLTDNPISEVVEFHASVAVVPFPELVPARQWLMEVVMPEVHSWLSVQRDLSPSPGGANWADWYWPSMSRRIHPAF